tara:strand:- start:17394 stop:17672 length:279 start_codon:yes stop_codon:yes gene_type:complete
MTTDVSSIEFIELDGKIQRTLDGIESMKDKQDQMAADIKQIKEAVYNPDEGIYARLRDLESWKKTYTKVVWIIIPGLFGLLFFTIKSHLFGQ